VLRNEGTFDIVSTDVTIFFTREMKLTKNEKSARNKTRKTGKEEKREGRYSKHVEIADLR